MRSEVGLGATALLLAGALGIGSQYAKTPTASTSGATGQAHVRGPQVVKPNAESDFDRGPCADLEDTLRAFLMAPEDEIAAPPSCYGRNLTNPEYLQNHLTSVTFQQKAGDMQFIIAMLPDPLHTHFSLSFDRYAEAIQQAAQDEGYFYNSSWLPWDTEEKPLVFLADQERADGEKKAREEQPGILLFRGRPDSAGKPAQQLYSSGLVVFIVGEEPTRGIHKIQFTNALRWVAELAPALSGQIKILGPTFSGSLPSLAQLLDEARQDKTITRFAGSPDNKLSIYSGGITSNTLVDWFRQKEDFQGVLFRSFQWDGNSLFEAYRRYLKALRFEASHLAILSEDDTAYGGYGSDAHDPLCQLDRSIDRGEAGPTCLYYPRDLSALRAAYQKQGIFSAEPKNEPTDTTQRQLSSEIADPEGDEHDTVRTYSGDQLALAQEAILAQIVSMLQAHASQYIVLRSSNPLDQLFLSHYLRQAYPAGRIVIEGSDLLLRRETGSAALSGIMTLTTYPLLPWEYDWTAPATDPPYLHAHRVFGQEGSEASYIALRFLLNAQSKKTSTQPAPPYQHDFPGFGDIADQTCVRASDCTYLMPNRFVKLNGVASGRPYWTKFALPDYSAPFWNFPEVSSDKKQSEAFYGVWPSIWLSVLGRDGFWPVAALTTPRDDENPSISKDAWDTAKSWAHLFTTFLWFAPSRADNTGWPHWPPMPLSMKLCLLLFFVLAGFHLHCCARPSITVKPVHRAHFVPIRGSSHSTLILFGTIVVAFIPILLAWGYGVMSLNGEPVPYAWWYRALLPLSWLMAALAVWFNAWDLVRPPEPLDKKETETKGQKSKNPPAGSQTPPAEPDEFMEMLRAIRKSFLFKRAFWNLWRKTVPFLLISLFLFWVVDFFLEQSLNKANRIPTYWRSIHLTTGVSPLVPLLALTAGLYAWFWYSLQGLALFGADRPRLPSQANLKITTGNNQPDLLTMFSDEGVAKPLQDLSDPLNSTTLCLAAVLFFAIAIGAWAIAGWNVPVRNLGSELSSIFGCLYMDLCISLMLANAWQFMRIWLQLRNLLLFLDRIAIRRTTKRLKDISWGSVWNMSGSILDVRYKLLSRQSESLTHLWNSIPKNYENAGWRAKLRLARAARNKFADWYAKGWDSWEERDLSSLECFQKTIARAAGYTLAKRLLPAWREEKNSLILDFEEKKDEKSKEDNKSNQDDCSDSKHEPKSLQILNAEELVCLVYLGFVQNILGRLRTLVMQMLWLFLALSAAAATYPFDPRPALSGTMMVLFLIVGTVVVIVYAQMHRDGTLSLVTNTTPGELGIDFWVKLAGFGAGPILGLLAANFPGITGSLFSWLQPGLESIK